MCDGGYLISAIYSHLLTTKTLLTSSQGVIGLIRQLNFKTARVSDCEDVTFQQSHSLEQEVILRLGCLMNKRHQSRGNKLLQQLSKMLPHKVVEQKRHLSR